jgi:hypothetical protein
MQREIQLVEEVLKMPDIVWSSSANQEELLTLARFMDIPEDCRALVENEDMED